MIGTPWIGSVCLLVVLFHLSICVGISLFCFYSQLFFFLAFFFDPYAQDCSKLSYIASYLTVTLYTLYTLTAYTHHGEL